MYRRIASMRANRIQNLELSQQFPPFNAWVYGCSLGLDRATAASCTTRGAIRPSISAS
jgi:hypothetical protein